MTRNSEHLLHRTAADIQHFFGDLTTCSKKSLLRMWILYPHDKVRSNHALPERMPCKRSGSLLS